METLLAVTDTVKRASFFYPVDICIRPEKIVHVIKVTDEDTGTSIILCSEQDFV